MKRLLSFCMALLLGVVVTAVKAEEAAFYVVKPGDTLLARFGSRAAPQIAKLNKLPDWNKIVVGQKLRLPDNIRGRNDVMVFKAVASKLHTALVKSVQSEEEFRWTKVGGAPLKDCGKKDEGTINEEAWVKLGLTDKEKSEIRSAIVSRNYRNTFFVPGQRFKAVAFCKSGEVSFKQNVVAAWQKNVVVLARTYVLKSGRVFHWARNCDNWVIGTPIPPAAPPVVVPQELQPEPPKLPSVPIAEEPAVPPVASPPEPEPQEVAPKEAVYRWDWELVVGQEHNRVSHSSFATGALYPLIVEETGAEHALGIGGTYSAWHGRTDTDFAFKGKLKGFGPAYKYSSYEGGYDFGAKILPWANLSENGSDVSGAYESRRRFNLHGLTLAYNNYAREMKGEKFFFKHQIFLLAFQPTGSAEAEHSWEGKPISDTKELSTLKHVVNIGGRVGLYDFSQEEDKVGLKLWFSAGWFQESPQAESANFRIQLSDKHERVFFGIGRDYDLLNGGALFGYGWSWDIRKTVYVWREEERQAQFVAAIERAGGSLDKDGMVRLPEGMKNSQKQYKTAPPDD